jgi:hypothetical protein
MLRKLLAPLLIVVVLGGAAGVAFAAHSHGDNGDQLKDAEKATTRFHSLPVADRAGYKLLLDKDGIACIDMPGMGAMGVHYANSALVGDGAIDPSTPEAMVYEPDGRGRMHLVAVEYVVLQAAWDGQPHDKPSLFGETFALTGADNRYGLPAFYSLHAWIYKDNPSGMFSMYNPNVTCTPDDNRGGQVDG